jgi:hypothetical protein
VLNKADSPDLHAIVTQEFALVHEDSVLAFFRDGDGVLKIIESYLIRDGLRKVFDSKTEIQSPRSKCRPCSVGKPEPGIYFKSLRSRASCLQVPSKDLRRVYIECVEIAQFSSIYGRM